MRRPVIGVMGGGDHASPEAIAWAEQLGRAIAAQGWVLLSGGRNAGVMDAASRGAHDNGGLVIGVLPGSDTSEVSDAVDVAIVTGLGNARNSVNVLSSDVVIACGETSAGTLSEVALAVKAGKPVVLLSTDDEAREFLQRIGEGRVYLSSAPEEAVERARALL
jgi:uncharacterized protein (TIGR00725 family)